MWIFFLFFSSLLNGSHVPTLQDLSITQVRKSLLLKAIESIKGPLEEDIKTNEEYQDILDEIKGSMIGISIGFFLPTLIEKVGQDLVERVLNDQIQIQQIAVGFQHTLMLTDTQDVIVFGSNSKGALGLTNQITTQALPLKLKLSQKIKYIATGFHTSFFINELDELWVFGENHLGQLGLGDFNHHHDPMKLLLEELVEESLYRKAIIDELSYRDDSKIIVTVHKIPKIKEIAAGNDHTIIITKSGQVYLFGNNTHKQLGIGDKVNYPTPQLLPFEHKIKEAAAGYYHSLLLTDEGEVYVCGRNDEGQIGLGHVQNQNTFIRLNIDDKISHISSNGDHSILLTENGEVFVFGNNRNGELGLGHFNNQNIPVKLVLDFFITEIIAGSQNTFLLTESGLVLVFGNNINGRLGLGNQIVAQNIPIILPLKEKITRLYSKGPHTMLMTEHKQILVFGNNNFGQLGLGIQSKPKVKPSLLYFSWISNPMLFDLLPLKCRLQDDNSSSILNS